MSEKVIGILGGMGPEATVDCFDKIIQNTPAAKDQDHIRVVIDSNPGVPDRTAAIIGDGESPVAVMAAGCHALKRAGADFIIIPCVSAHFFLADLCRQSPLPILSIFDAVAENIAGDHAGIKTVGLLGTTGTVRGGLFQKRLEQDAIQTLVCDDKMQSQVMAAIYDIKNVHAARTRSEITTDLIAAAEIPLALKQEHLPIPYFDAVTILARAAIMRAGRKPLSLPR